MSCICDLGIFNHCSPITFKNTTALYEGVYTYRLYANGSYSVYTQNTLAGELLRIYSRMDMLGNYIGLNLNEHTIYEVEIIDPNGNLVEIGECTKFRFRTEIIPYFTHQTP